MTCGEPFGPALFCLLSSRGGGPNDMRGTIWSRTFFTFCHQEAAGSMTCGEPFGPALFHLLSSRGGGPNDMRGTIWSQTFLPLSSRSGGPDDMWRHIMVIRTLLLSVKLDE